MQKYFVYILQFLDESYYVGLTNEIDRRFDEHKHCIDLGSYVTRKGPFRLAYVEIFTNVDDAIHREKQLQGWSRAKKEALIDNDITMLKTLARRRTGRPQ